MAHFSMARFRASGRRRRKALMRASRIDDHDAIGRAHDERPAAEVSIDNVTSAGPIDKQVSRPRLVFDKVALVGMDCWAMETRCCAGEFHVSFAARRPRLRAAGEPRQGCRGFFGCTPATST